MPSSPSLSSALSVSPWLSRSLPTATPPARLLLQTQFWESQTQLLDPSTLALNPGLFHLTASIWCLLQQNIALLFHFFSGHDLFWRLYVYLDLVRLSQRCCSRPVHCSYSSRFRPWGWLLHSHLRVSSYIHDCICCCGCCGFCALPLGRWHLCPCAPCTCTVWRGFKTHRKLRAFHLHLPWRLDSTLVVVCTSAINSRQQSYLRPLHAIHHIVVLRHNHSKRS